MTPLDVLLAAGIALLIFVSVVGTLAVKRDARAGRATVSEGSAQDNVSARRQTGGIGSPYRRSVAAARSAEEDIRGGPRTPWNPFVSRPRRGEGPDVEYRSRPGDLESQGGRWNPYDEEQSMNSRIRAARRRPHKIRTELDYYQLLGVERGASDAEIVRAYRRHAATIHPDRFYDDPVRRGQAEEKLKQLNHAMQVLRDPVARARYDAEL